LHEDSEYLHSLVDNELGSKGSVSLDFKNLKTRNGEGASTNNVDFIIPGT